MSSDCSISGVKAFEDYPFPFVRVDMRPDLGTCAVMANSKEGGVLLMPNVTPVDVDAYELKNDRMEPAPFWIDGGLVYGVSWKEGK